MKIVGFEANGQMRLGVVEGDQVIDLQAADAKAPNDLGEWLARDNGDLTAARPISPRGAGLGPPSACLAEVCVAGRAAGQDHLPRPQLSRSRQGRAATRDNLPKFPTIFFRDA